MSVAEIIQELPKLSHHERRELSLRILSLEPDQEDLNFALGAARSGFAILEEMEAEDMTNAKRQQG